MFLEALCLVRHRSLPVKAFPSCDDHAFAVSFRAIDAFSNASPENFHRVQAFVSNFN